MLSDAIVMYFVAQLIILLINIIGYSKIPLLLFFGIIGTVILAVPTLIGFGDFIMIGLLLILINISLPIVGLTKSIRGE